MDIVVRPVERGDVPAVIALVRDVLAEFGLQFGKGSPTDAQLLELPDAYAAHGGAFWVATQGGALAGTCGVFLVEPAIFELRKMYLMPGTRGLGLGKRLLDVAVAWTREQGGTHLVLDTVDEMTRAIAFYEANGFTRDDSQIRGARCTRGYARRL